MRTSTLLTVALLALSAHELQGQPTHVFWIDSIEHQILRADLASSTIDTVFSATARQPAGLAIDSIDQRVYWTYEGGGIDRADWAGNLVEEIIGAGVCGIGKLTDIEVDVVSRRMFWGYDGDCGGNINKANLDGSDVGTVFAQGGRPPRNIAVDATSSVLYFSDGIPPNPIFRTNYDASDISSLQPGPAFGIAVDLRAGMLYWSEAAKIMRSNIDGTGPEDVVTGLDGVMDIALDTEGRKLFWTERDVGKIRRSNLDGSSVQDLLTGLPQPTRIELAHVASTGVERGKHGAHERRLHPNHPNPFADATTISYRLLAPDHVTLSIHDLLGRQVALLVSEVRPSGTHSVSWTANTFPSGVYICVLQVGDSRESQFLVRLRQP